MQVKPKSDKSFTELLLPLSKLYRDREEALLELTALIEQFPKKDINKAIGKLDIFPASQLTSLYQSYQNRIAFTEYQGFRLGEKVKYIGINYNNLSNVILTIVEFDLPWIACTRPSGTYAPGLTIEDIGKS